MIQNLGKVDKDHYMQEESIWDIDGLGMYDYIIDKVVTEYGREEFDEYYEETFEYRKRYNEKDGRPYYILPQIDMYDTSPETVYKVAARLQDMSLMDDWSMMDLIHILYKHCIKREYQILPITSTLIDFSNSGKADCI